MILKDTFNLKKNNDFKDFNFFIEQLAYDKDTEMAVYYNIKTLETISYRSSKNYR